MLLAAEPSLRSPFFSSWHRVGPFFMSEGRRGEATEASGLCQSSGAFCAEEMGAKMVWHRMVYGCDKASQVQGLPELCEFKASLGN